MSGNGPEIALAERHRIGQAVVEARAGGIDWKDLQRLYGRSRVQLWRYAQDSMTGGPATPDYAGLVQVEPR